MPKGIFMPKKIMYREFHPDLCPSYLTAQMLSQPWPAGGAVINDWLFGTEDTVSLRGIFFITSIDNQPTHFDQAIPVILMEVG